MPGVLGGGVVDRGGGAARELVDEVRRDARDDPARDRARRADLLVALPVAEVVAVHLARAAAVRAPALGAPRAEPAADARPAAVLHAVDVVAGAATAEARVIGAPPSSGERARRAGVEAAFDERAAELRVAVGAERPRRAAGHLGVRRPGPGHEVDARRRDRGAGQRGADQEAASAGPLLDEAGGLHQEPVGDGDALALARGPGRPRVGRRAHGRTDRAAARVFGSAVSARNTRPTPTATSSRNGMPSSGWSASTSGRLISDGADEHRARGDTRGHDVEHDVQRTRWRVDLAEAPARADRLARPQRGGDDDGEERVRHGDAAPPAADCR